MRQLAPVGAGFLAVASMLLWAADDQPRKAQVEPMSQDRFSEIHAPLFQPPKSNNAGALTERIAASLPATKASSAPIPRRNFVDQHIFAKMERDRVPHAALTSDNEFLRRVTLDLTGRIPSPQEVTAFTADSDSAKRDKVVDKLLASEAYVDKWAYTFMDIFRANGKMGRGQYLFHYWMKENLRVDRPYDDVVRSVISSSAKSNHVSA